jgi:hypothetical protein
VHAETVAPLGAVTLVVNIFNAAYFLKEDFDR